jgi:hypothetical protein
LPGVNHEKCPARNKHQQSNGCLVDFRDAFNGNEEIADDKNDYYR